MLVNDPEGIKKILEETKTIAVVGFSDDPGKAGYFVPEHLQGVGYRIIPVNPNLTEGLGEKCYPSLLDIPKDIQVDMVDCLRRIHPRNRQTGCRHRRQSPVDAKGHYQ